MRFLATAAAAMLVGVAATAASAQDGPGDLMGGFHEPIDFVAIDADGDGSLTRAELQARAVERIARADENADGSLDREEIVAFLPGPRGGLLGVFAEDPAERMTDRLIALMGGTETGRVEVAALAERRVNALLAFADEDRDAVISQEEATAMLEGMHEGRGRGRGHGRDRDRGDGPRSSEPRG